MQELLDSNYPGVHRVGVPPRIFLYYNTMIKSFASNFFSQGSVEQEYLSKNVKDFSFLGV